MECKSLPEGCIATILSRTTPLDTCKLSLVSTSFYSASQSDSVWSSFLPSDYISIMSRSVPDSSFLPTSPSKKSLYLALSDHPILIDHHTKSFQLDRKSGKKCYMLAARALHISWGDTPQYWTWEALPESRFPEVAKLLWVCWLEIRGAINTNALSPNTHYAAYLVFRMIDTTAYYCCYGPVELSVDIFGGQSSTKSVCLGPNTEERPHLCDMVQGLQHPNVRSDGWLEIEMGTFFNSGLEDEEVQMSVVETKILGPKSGLVIEGIEVRPKEDN